MPAEAGLDPAPDALPGSGPVIVAFSGGGDSVCLLHQLRTLQSTRGLTAVHIDHGLDHGSAKRADKALELAAAAGVHCQVERVKVRRSGSLEANAREARYAALSAHVQDDVCLVTGHHADDQAETMILRLLRGAGPGGLSGIPRRRSFGAGWLVRPLLGWTRARIAEYLGEHQLDWISDPSNELLALDRNFIRHEIMPLLKTKFPGAVKSINRSADLNRAALGSLNEIAAADLARASLGGGRLDWTLLSGLGDFRSAEAIRRWCIQAGYPPPPGIRLEECLRQLRCRAPDRVPQLRWADAIIRGWRGQLWLDTQDPGTPLPWSKNWCGQLAIDLPSPSGRLEILGSGFGTAQDLTVCSGRDGESVQLAHGSVHRRVKQLLAEHGVPPWHRRHWPRVYRGEKLLAVGDQWLDTGFARELASAGCRLRWRTHLYRP